MASDILHAAVQKCTECEAEYAALDGGECASCKRSLCGKHFAGYFSEGQPGAEQICDRCYSARGGGKA